MLKLHYKGADDLSNEEIDRIDRAGSYEMARRSTPPPPPILSPLPCWPSGRPI